MGEALKEWNADVGHQYRGDIPFEQFVFVQNALTWRDFIDWHEPLHSRWGFRGQGDASWSLTSALDRVIGVNISTEDFGNFKLPLKVGFLESRTLASFKRCAHQHIVHLPPDDDLASWLALMQHHGVPTRLLDWTKSPYVAAYFAAEDAKEAFAIWAVDLEWLNFATATIQPSLANVTRLSGSSESRHELNELLRRSQGEDVNAIVRIDPSSTDSRMTSQQGFFLCKLNSVHSFDVLLINMLNHQQAMSMPPIRKLEISGDLRLNFLRKLRSANVHRGSLFPGLDGFARSLYFDWLIDSDEMAQEIHIIDPPRDDQGFAEE